MFPIHFLIAPIRSEQLNPGVNCTKWSQISWYANISQENELWTYMNSKIHGQAKCAW